MAPEASGVALLLSTRDFDAMTTLAVLANGLVMYLIAVPLAVWWRNRTDR